MENLAIYYGDRQAALSNTFLPILEVDMTVRVSNTRINGPWAQERQPQPVRCLSAQEIERLDGMQLGDTIVCTNGVLWVTQEGDLEDYLLRKGEKFAAHRLGLVLIQALTDSACRCYLNFR
jgi:hypothetical protein